MSDLDGANAVQLTDMRAPTGTGVPHWSPDGSVIAFASDAEGQFDIFVVPVAGGKPRNLTADPAFDHVPAFSRDGTSLYFSSSRSGQFQIWQMPVARGQAVKVIDGALNGAFAVVDGGIYFLDVAPGIRIQFYDFATRKATVVARDLGPGAEIGGFHASADGRTMLFVRRESAVDDLMLVENCR